MDLQWSRGVMHLRHNLLQLRRFLNHEEVRHDQVPLSMQQVYRQSCDQLLVELDE